MVHLDFPHLLLNTASSFADDAVFICGSDVWFGVRTNCKDFHRFVLADLLIHLAALQEEEEGLVCICVS